MEISIIRLKSELYYLMNNLRDIFQHFFVNLLAGKLQPGLHVAAENSITEPMR